jgi:hypothetical protein
MTFRTRRMLLLGLITLLFITGAMSSRALECQEARLEARKLRDAGMKAENDIISAWRHHRDLSEEQLNAALAGLEQGKTDCEVAADAGRNGDCTAKRFHEQKEGCVKENKHPNCEGWVADQERACNAQWDGTRGACTTTRDQKRQEAIGGFWGARAPNAEADAQAAGAAARKTKEDQANETELANCTGVFTPDLPGCKCGRIVKTQCQMPACFPNESPVCACKSCGGLGAFCLDCAPTCQ